MEEFDAPQIQIELP